MNISVQEIALCAGWAKEHCEDDDPVDVMTWKLLEICAEKAARSARYHARTVAEISTDMASLSLVFYETEGGDPDGDPDVEF